MRSAAVLGVILMLACSEEPRATQFAPHGPRPLDGGSEPASTPERDSGREPVTPPPGVDLQTENDAPDSGQTVNPPGPPPMNACDDVVDPATVHVLARAHHGGSADFLHPQFLLLGSTRESRCVVMLREVQAPAVDVDGRLLVVDYDHHRLRHVVFDTLRFSEGMWTFMDRPDHPIDTPGCTVDDGVATFVLGPARDEIYYNCHGDAYDCDEHQPTGQPQASSSSGYCADGPYFDMEGKMVTEAILFAVFADGTLLTSAGLVDPVTGLVTDASAAALTDDSHKAARRHGDDLSIVVVSGAKRSLIHVTSKGEVSMEGSYPDLPSGSVTRGFELDAEDRLWEVVFEGIAMQQQEPITVNVSEVGGTRTRIEVSDNVKSGDWQYSEASPPVTFTDGSYLATGQ